MFLKHTLKFEDTKNGERYGFTFEPWNTKITADAIIWVASD